MAKHQAPAKSPDTFETLMADTQRLRALADRSLDRDREFELYPGGDSDPDADPRTLTGNQIRKRLVAACAAFDRLQDLEKLLLIEEQTVVLRAELGAEYGPDR